MNVGQYVDTFSNLLANRDGMHGSMMAVLVLFRVWAALGAMV
jgi:hypothetical protein